MKICSWDVGIINLSYCIIEFEDTILEHPYQKNMKNYKIIHWGIINLMENKEMKKNRNLLFENIPKKLNEIAHLLDVDYVVIENQPSLKNPQMKSIQMIVYSYFLMYGKVLNSVEEKKIKQIDFCNASNKLKMYKGPVIDLNKVKEEEKEKKLAEKNAKKVKATKKNKKNQQELITQYMTSTSHEKTNDNDDGNEADKEEENNEDQETNEEEEINNEEEERNSEEEERNSEEEENNEEKTKDTKKTSKNPKLTYTDKKKMAVEHVKYFLNNDDQNLAFFLTHKKKDDLADSFLQGLYQINMNIK
jgi:flagellar biosynthesis GTPase FlhF